MSAAAVPLHSRPKRIHSYTAQEDIDHPMYNPFDPQEQEGGYVAHSNKVRTELIEKGKLREGLREISILLYIEELLFAYPIKRKGTFSLVREWTEDITDAEMAKRSGSADSDAVRDVRDVMEELCQVRILAGRPGTRRGTYQYKLLVHRWSEAPTYEERRTARKPPAREDSARVEEPEEPAETVVSGGEEKGKGEQKAKGLPGPSGFFKSLILKKGKIEFGGKIHHKAPQLVYEEPTIRTVEFDAQNEVPIIIDQYWSGDHLRIVTRDAPAATASPEPVPKPPPEPEPPDRISEASPPQLKDWIAGVSIRYGLIDAPPPRPGDLPRILEAAGSATFEGFELVIKATAKSKFKSPTFWVFLAKEAAGKARVLAGVKAKHTPTGPVWDKPWEEDPAGENVGQWRASGANLKMSYNEWLGVEWQRRRNKS